MINDDDLLYILGAVLFVAVILFLAAFGLPAQG